MTPRIIELESSGCPLEVSKRVGVGGFAEVFDHSLNRTFVVKIGEVNEAKLRATMRGQVVPSSPGHVYYWPVDLAVENGAIVGYAMHKAPEQSVDLLTVIAAAEWLPNRFLLRVARNQAASLVDLHRAGFVRADLPNCLVDRHAIVHEVDLDSAAEYRGGAEWHASTGKRDFSAPEVQALLGEGDYTSTTEHDAWGLMVIVWLLLMEGCHPFDCRWLSTGPRPERWERVRDGVWGYDRSCRLAEPRRDDPPIDRLPPEVRRLAVKTFDRGALEPARRPAADDVLDVLESLDIGGEVTLTDDEWAAVSDGSGPVIQGRLSRAGWKRSLSAATAAALGGTALYWSAGSPLDVNQAGFLPSRQEPARIRPLSAPTRTIRLSLVDLEPPHSPGETPSLWRAIEELR